MKKKRCFISVIFICLLCIGLVGCVSEKIDNNDLYIKTLLSIKTEIDSTNEVLDSVDSVIKWQVDGAESDLKLLNTAQENYEIYDGASLSTENANEKYQEFEAAIETIKASKEKINGLEKTDVEQINMTIDAANEYYDRLLLALEDLNEVFEFNKSVNSIVSKMGSVDVSSYESGAAATKAVFESVDSGISELNAIKCPSFMQQVFDKEILGYKRLLEIIYEENSGYIYSDAMKFHSAINMYSRVNYELQQYRIDLLNDYNMQFKKVSERLNKQIMPIRDEINNNLYILLSAMDYEVEGEGGK